MKEIRWSDLQIAGCAFTLFPVCDEMGISIDCARAILWAMHIKAKTIRKSGFVLKKNEKIIAQNPVLPNVLSKKNFRYFDLKFIQLSEENGLVKTIGKDEYKITEKMQEVLQKTAQRYSKLKGKN